MLFNYSLSRMYAYKLIYPNVYLLFHNMFQLLTLVLLSFRFSTCNLFKSTKPKVNVANVHFTGWLTNMKTGNSPVCMYVCSFSSSPLRRSPSSSSFAKLKWALKHYIYITEYRDFVQCDSVRFIGRNHSLEIWKLLWNQNLSSSNFISFSHSHFFLFLFHPQVRDTTDKICFFITYTLDSASASKWFTFFSTSSRCFINRNDISIFIPVHFTKSHFHKFYE